MGRDVAIGWIATGPTPIKRADLEHSPFMSLNYWAPNHDTCRADCKISWHFDDATRTGIWNAFKPRRRRWATTRR